jgi:predicted Ser/Thr protein kinase
MNKYSGIDISNLKFIGQGTQGKVYFLPPDKVIKIFHRKRSCQDQIFILQCAKNSRFFPKVYNHDDYSIVMDFVPGVTLKEYLENNKLSKKLAFELVELICEFERLGFTRLDIRAPHIFVQADESIIAIDPRKSFQIVQKYPLKILGTLKKFGALDQFFMLIKNRYNDKYSEWKNL